MDAGGLYGSSGGHPAPRTRSGARREFINRLLMATAGVGERRAPDPEVVLQAARDAAWSALNRRDHTVLEMQRVLERRRVEPQVAGVVIEELLEGGWLDDARYAQRFAEDRRRLDEWGAERIERKLLSLGIDREDVAAAVAEQPSADEMDAALTLLGRRFPDPPETPRDRDRALGVLVRKGYSLELAYDALRRYAGAGACDEI